MPNDFYTHQRELCTILWVINSIYFLLVSLDEDEAEKQRRTIVAKYDRVSTHCLSGSSTQFNL